MVYLNGTVCDACDGERTIDGVPCGACEGDGRFGLSECPSKLMTAEVRRVMQAADFVRKGCLPFGGGVLDQPAALMDAIAMVHSCESPHRVKCGLGD